MIQVQIQVLQQHHHRKQIHTLQQLFYTTDFDLVRKLTLFNDVHHHPSSSSLVDKEQGIRNLNLV